MQTITQPVFKAEAQIFRQETAVIVTLFFRLIVVLKSGNAVSQKLIIVRVTD